MRRKSNARGGRAALLVLVRPMGRPGGMVLLGASAALAVILALILRHPIFLTNDSMNDYAHVWYVSDRLWSGHGLPVHMPVLAHGRAYAFPYAFIPWTLAALVRPLLGDWAVTLGLVLGVLAVVAGTLVGFPEMRRPWWAAMVILNPVLLEGPLLGQMPFLWAAAFLMFAIAAWRGGRTLLAGLLAGCAGATHPAVLLPLIGALVLVRMRWEPRRGRLVAAYVLSLVLAAPAAYFTLASPVFSETSVPRIVANFFGTVGLRALVPAAPFIGLALQRTPLARAPLLIVAVLIALNAAFVPLRHDAYAWRGLMREPDRSLDGFFQSGRFVPGATYRVLAAGDAKYGMYQALRHGAVLDSEFFPESMALRSWPSEHAYGDFLRKRTIDYVIIFGAYDRGYGTNEHALLRAMAARGPVTGRVCVRAIEHRPLYDVYAIARAGCRA
ncbi:MAG: hypothetical protein KGK07_03010 [Chloroflexota bacterium]|nr:hypothetical protein [Chloroflexota bacterium]